jgi:hypothetical protein
MARLYGQQLRVDGDVFLRGRFRATGTSDAGTVRLLGAHIRGSLVMSGAQLSNDTGPQLIGDTA